MDCVQDNLTRSLSEHMQLKSILILLALYYLGSNVYALTEKEINSRNKHKNLSFQDLKNAEYKVGRIGEGEDLQTLRLTKYKKKDPNDTSEENTSLMSYALGDINGDGLGDAVAVVDLNTGGSGYFTYLTVLINDHGKPHCVAYECLGDRSQCNNLKITNQKIICDMLTHAPSDPASDPTLRRVLKYKLVKNKLIGPHDVQ